MSMALHLKKKNPECLYCISLDLPTWSGLVNLKVRNFQDH